MKLIFVEEFGKAFIPKKIRPHLGKYLLKAGMVDVPYKLFGGFFYISLLVTLSIFLLQVYPRLMGERVLKTLFYTFGAWVGIQLGVVGFLVMIYYMYIEQKIFIRTQKMEEVLEDFLHLVSENLKGGLTLEESFWNAVKPEFGVLSKEIRLTAKKVMTGEDVADALREFMGKYNSPILTRSFNLVLQSMEGGGKISDIIDRVIKNIIETKRLKKEMGATNLTYVIFISFIVLIIAPGLFVLSNQFLIILGTFSATLGSSTGGGAGSGLGMGFNIGSMSIDPTLFKKFSLWGVMIISFFASMIISIIQKGSIRGGIKFIPMYCTGSLIMYLLISKIADVVIGSYFSLI